MNEENKPTPSSGAWKGFFYVLPFGLLSWVVIILLAVRCCGG
jgi:hypothetical protein